MPGETYQSFMWRLKSQPYDVPVPLPAKAWPLMVTFDDLTDPTTVREVDPNDLAASFGPGVRLKAVRLEMTAAPVTEGRLDSLLPWLGPYAETPLLDHISPTDFSFEAQLRQGNLIARAMK